MSGAVVRGDDGARPEMLHPDLLEFHVEPASEDVCEREPFVVPVELFDVCAFRLDAHHLGGELTAGDLADAEIANERPWRGELELSLLGMTYVGVEHERVLRVAAEATLTRLCGRPPTAPFSGGGTQERLPPRAGRTTTGSWRAWRPQGPGNRPTRCRPGRARADRDRARRGRLRQLRARGPGPHRCP